MKWQIHNSIEVPDMGWLSIIADPTGAALVSGNQKLVENILEELKVSARTDRRWLLERGFGT